MKIDIKFKLLVSGVLLLYNMAMYSGVKAQIYDFPHDNSGEITVQLEGNLIGISGLVYNNQIPSFEDLVDYDEKCISFYPDTAWWHCGNRGERAGWANSESYLYWRRIIVHEGCDEACIRLRNHPEREPICLKNNKNYMNVFIDDACGNHLKRGEGDIDDRISFSAILYYKNTYGNAQPSPTINCCIWASGRPTYIILTRTEIIGDEKAYYSGSGIFTPRGLAGGVAEGAINIKFSASYVFWTTTNMQFRDNSGAFEVTGLNFENEIPLAFNDNGAIHCLPFDSYMNIGEIVNLGAGTWPSATCYPTSAEINAYDFNGNLIATSSGTVVAGHFETGISSNGRKLTPPRGESEVLTLNFKIKINGGPEREIQPYSGMRVEVYNGFRALPPRIIGAKADYTIKVNEPITLEAGTDPNLAPGVADGYEWQYEMISSPYYLATFSQQARTTTFTATGPGIYGVCYIVRTSTVGWAASDATVIEVKPNLEITHPLDGDKFTFTQEAQGTLAINCQANVTPDLIGDLIEWSITDSPGSTLKPESHTGTQTFFNYEGLPADNGQFGIKMIIASIPQYDIADTINVKIYYPKYVNNHGANPVDEPNWMYYWRQTSASKGCFINGNRINICNDSTIAWTHRGDRCFYICPAASDSSKSPECPGEPLMDGIDLFAVTCIHENVHIENWISWYEVRPDGSPAPFNRDTDDLDQDMIPDSLEPSMGFDPTMADTDRDRRDDGEELAYRAECQWMVGSADSEDWANPGHQF